MNSLECKNISKSFIINNDNLNVFSDINLSYIDILFETISGLTTTGSSIITNVESVDKSLLIWRSTTQWLGGMGVIVLTITVLPTSITSL